MIGHDGRERGETRPSRAASDSSNVSHLMGSDPNVTLTGSGGELSVSDSRSTARFDLTAEDMSSNGYTDRGAFSPVTPDPLPFAGPPR